MAERVEVERREARLRHWSPITAHLNLMEVRPHT